MTIKTSHEESSEHKSATRLQPDPVVEAYKRDLDRTLLRENLKLTVEQRFLKLRNLQRFATELRKAGSASAP